MAELSRRSLLRWTAAAPIAGTVAMAGNRVRRRVLDAARAAETEMKQIAEKWSNA